MKLYHTDTSPYARKVKIVLKELGKDDLVDYIFTHPFENPGELLEKNPLGKVPALELEDGTVLYESMIICDYLDQKFNHGHFFSYFRPVEKQVQLFLAHSILDSAIGLVLESRRPDDKKMDAKYEYYINAIKRCLDQLEKEFEKNVAGNINIYSISLAVSLGYLDFRIEPFYDWRSDYPKLVSWFVDFKNRPSFKETEPPKN